MRKGFIAYVVLGVTAGAAFLTLNVLQHPTPATQSYLIQAASTAEARALVVATGAEITHELRVINSVGARLTPAQFDALQENKNVRRIYKDSGVNTTANIACSVVADEHLVFDDDEVHWTITNAGSSSLYLETITVFWPATNDALEEIGFDKDEIFFGQIDGISAALEATNTAFYSERLKIGAGQSHTLELEFDDDVVRDQNAYEILLTFRGNCAAKFPVPPFMKFAGDSDVDAKRTYVASLIGADTLHWQGITGEGVSVAVIDTGSWGETGKAKYLSSNASNKDRVSGHYDAIKNMALKLKSNSDKNGHGSHVTSLLASSRHKDSEFNGIAPDAELVVVQAFDDDGAGTYADVIRGIDWVISNKDALGIRVLNLSFGGRPASWYWDDPLNQAVMAAWRDGIVVVASAGNEGPAPMTVGVPGNVPYIITVGAMTDSVTPLDWTDDTLATFSSAGPTFEAFVKPELVAPGGHLRGLMEQNNKIAKAHPHYYDGDSYFTMSGTSQSTAVVSGAVALLLSAEPWLTPDQVKCRLMRSARQARNVDGSRGYSVFQQGAGMIDVNAALMSTKSDCANRGLDVNADLAGIAHYRGPAALDKYGRFYITGVNGHEWDGSYGASDGYLWGGGMLWNDGMLWNNGMLWNDGNLWNNGMLWNDGNLWNNGMLWNDGSKPPVHINIWVEQE